MKTISSATALAFCLTLSACGGGDDGGASPPPAFKLTYSGAPIARAQSARAMADARMASSASGAGGAAADGQATVDALQAALKARGAEIAVSPGVIDGTTLHQIVMSENGGKPPTDAELEAANDRAIANSWVLVNFQFDDMLTRTDNPAQDAAIIQFRRDLDTYVKRERVKGNVVFVPAALSACDNDNYRPQVALGVIFSQTDFLRVVGGVRVTPEHMDATCLIPDAYLRDAYINSIADTLAGRYRTALDTIDKCKHNPEAIPKYERAGQCWGISPEKK